MFAGSTIIDPTDRDPLSGLTSPVYSLSTNGYGDGNATMNIITYCSPVSIEPRYLALGLFRRSMSLNNFLGHGRGVLQVQYPSAAIAKTKQLAVSSAFTKVHVGRFVDPKTIRFTFVNVRVREAPQGRDIEGIVFVFSDRARGAADAQDRLFPSLTPREISYMA
jgi:hypothetical protein